MPDAFTHQKIFIRAIKECHYDKSCTERITATAKTECHSDTSDAFGHSKNDIFSVMVTQFSIYYI